jgi:hypothetical protein
MTYQANYMRTKDLKYQEIGYNVSLYDMMGLCFFIAYIASVGTVWYLFKEMYPSPKDFKDTILCKVYIMIIPIFLERLVINHHYLENLKSSGFCQFCYCQIDTIKRAKHSNLIIVKLYVACFGEAILIDMITYLSYHYNFISEVKTLYICLTVFMFVSLIGYLIVISYREKLFGSRRNLLINDQEDYGSIQEEYMRLKDKRNRPL